MFHRVVCNEAQRLNSPGIVAHIAVARLHAPMLSLLTATMIKRPIDLPELLQLVWKSEFSKPDDNLHSSPEESHSDSRDKGAKGPSQLEKFKEASALNMTTALSSLNGMERCLGSLDPYIFMALMATLDGGTSGPLFR